MLGHDTFYHSTIRKYVALFGTLFNDIHIERDDANGDRVQLLKVPIGYGPKQKYLARILSQPDLSTGYHAAYLPRMSFEIVATTFAADRKQNSSNKLCFNKPGTPGSFRSMYAPVPYDFDFQLSIYAKNVEDGLRIVEQILPFFTPAFTVNIEQVPDLDLFDNIKIINNAVSPEDVYEGSYEERRVHTWTLDFTLKGWLYGPVSDAGGIIKTANVNFFDTLTSTDVAETIHVEPYATYANGDPVPVANVSSTDTWVANTTIISGNTA